MSKKKIGHQTTLLSSDELKKTVRELVSNIKNSSHPTTNPLFDKLFKENKAQEE